jgi:magnesium Mg(2+) and cobalt Co(2+) transport protein (corA)
MTARRRNKQWSEPPIYTGQFNIKTHIQCISYSADSISEKEVSTVKEILENIKDGSTNWIRIFGMTDTKLIIDLISNIGLDVMDAKDILTTQHIMTVEEYDNTIFIVLPILYSIDGENRSEQVALILGKNYLITIKESDHHLFESIYTGIKNSKRQKYNTHSAGFLMASVLNEVINSYGDEILRLENELEELEDLLLDIKQMNPGIISDIQEKRRKLIRLRKTLFPFKDQLSKLLRVERGLIEEKEISYYKDVYDQLLYLLQNIESCREILSSLVDLYLSNNDVRMNRVMKQLTLVATIFIPLTFLVGVWGMNFQFMPELSWKYGYLFAWVVMILIGIIVWWYLKRKDWT